MHTKKSLFTKILIYTVLTALLVVVVFPILSLITSSFKTNSEIMTTPEKLFSASPTLDNYIEAWNSENFRVGHMVFNSVWYSVISVILDLFLSALCGYVFARGVFRGKKLIFAVFSSLMFISLGSITIYPTFSILSKFNLSTSLWGLLVMQCFGIPVVSMYIVRGFINALPTELDEAAKMDGCGFFRIYYQIILPMLKPILATIALLSFRQGWNEYILPLVFTMTNDKLRPLTVGVNMLKNAGDGTAAWNIMFAGATISIVPILIVYCCFSRFFMGGLTAGAVKG